MANKENSRSCCAFFAVIGERQKKGYTERVGGGIQQRAQAGIQPGYGLNPGTGGARSTRWVNEFAMVCTFKAGFLSSQKKDKQNKHSMLLSHPCLQTQTLVVVWMLFTVSHEDNTMAICNKKIQMVRRRGKRSTSFNKTRLTIPTKQWLTTF